MKNVVITVVAIDMFPSSKVKLLDGRIKLEYCYMYFLHFCTFKFRINA